MRCAAWTVAALVLGGCSLLAAREPGLPVGSRMPDFEMPDQAGKTHSVKSLLAAKGAVILFYRSADW
jgi:hypothetical protein